MAEAGLNGPMGDAPDYLDELARFAWKVRYEDLPESVVRRARWVFADSLAVIAAGMQSDEMRRLVAALQPRSSGQAWIIGSGTRSDRRLASLLNGAAGTWLELDEGHVHAAGHPGIQLLPAAIAYAQEEDASGEALLAAVVAGYEVSARIARAASLRPTSHPHGTWGVLGAAVTIAKLMRLPEGRIREVMNVAADTAMATSSGTLRDGATVRNIYSGHSNWAGQLAVDMVQAGFTGERDGVGAVFGEVLSDGIDRGSVLRGLGTEWLLTGGYFKLIPTARTVHSAVEALEDALARAPGPGLDHRDVERIMVKAYRKTARMNERVVATPFAARFSVPYALAARLVCGKLDIESFDAATVRRPEIRSLCAKVEIEEDAAFTALYPRRQHCQVSISTKDGRLFAGASEIMKGEPENPVTERELEDKYMSLARRVWREDLASRLLRDCMKLETVSSFRAYSSTFSL